MSVPSVRTQVKEPVSEGVTLGTLAVVTEDTKLTVDITEPGGGRHGLSQVDRELTCRRAAF